MRWTRWPTFLAQICNLIQLFHLQKFLLNPVKNVIVERARKADSQIADAMGPRTEAGSWRRQRYEQNLRMPAPRPIEIVANAEDGHRRGEEGDRGRARTGWLVLPSSRRPS